MSLLDKAAIFRFHNKLASKFGKGTIRALGWKDTEGQQARFKVLSGIGNLDNHSVLDAGCGHGDLREYLGRFYPHSLYYGVEQIPGLLQEAVELTVICLKPFFMKAIFMSPNYPSLIIYWLAVP